eukprot:866627-Prymnesium_polylepis.1
MASKVAITLAFHSAVMPAAEVSSSGSESSSGGMACTLHQPAMDSGQASDSCWCTTLANTSGGQRRVS